MSIDLTEAQVTEQCLDYLIAEGWRCVRQHSQVLRQLHTEQRVQVGEPGIPDWIIMPTRRVHDKWGGYADTFFLEFKRTKGGRLRESQKIWIPLARADGLLVCVCRGLDELKKWMVVNL